jgi:hypothetical protein
MARSQGTVSQLEALISQLQTERKEHETAIADIDKVFERFGLQPAQPKRRGRARGRRPGRPRGVRSRVQAAAPAARRRTRGRGRRSFGKSGAQSVLDFVKSKGARGTTTSEINQHWKSEGRAGDAYVTLGQLVNKRQLKRENLKGQRGSRYVA